MKHGEWTAKIVNPELIPQVCDNMTKVVIEMFSNGEIVIPKKSKELKAS